jgi:hypothetical protein
VWWRSLFLKPAAARRFIPFIRENFPEHEARTAAFYERSVYAPHAYDEYLGKLFDRLRRKHGFDPSAQRHMPMESTGVLSGTPAGVRQQQLSLVSR